MVENGNGNSAVARSAAVRDSTERTEIESRFPGLLAAAQDAFLAVDDRGVIVLVNHKAEELFGYGRKELIGKPLQTLIPERARRVHPALSAAYFADPSSRPMAQGQGPSARRKDGTEVPVDISLSSVATDRGLLVTATVRDVTDRTRIEVERARRDASAVEAEWDEEREMFEAQLQQAQRLESIGQLAGGVAHDFNNLLAGIMNYAGLVSSSLEEQMEQRGLKDDAAFVTLLEDVAEITSVAKRAAALTHQLLVFGRRTVAQPEVLDVSSVVLGMEDLLRRTIGENVDHLRTDLTAGLPMVKADRGQLEQVVMNLAVNARDAMPGGGELVIETSAISRGHGLRRDDPTAMAVRLEVSDTGTGMAQEVADRAFEPFFTTKHDGTGLGLATVYGIVTQAGGRASIRSSPGAGTTVRVDLPSTTDHVTVARAAPSGSPPQANGETVLLVEDEVIVAEPTRRMLQRHGYSVLSATTADEALAIAVVHDGPIDLLLTDVVMPGRSGKDLADDIAILRPETKVLFTSGYSRDVLAQEGVLADGVHLLPKPSSGEELLRKVRHVLAGP